MTITTNLNEERQVAQVLIEILDDEQQFVSEKRSDYRALLFVPVQVSQPEFECEVSGFTKDVSTHGVCLIMPQPFRQGAEAQINLFGHTSEITSVATCCWSSKFGDAYWISGWSLKDGIAVGRLLKEDRSVDSEQRSSDRLQVAIPVGVHLPGNTYRVPGFTRNLSLTGLCLVSKVETQPNQIANLEIIRLNGESVRIESRCMWAKQYDEDYWISGWMYNL